MVKGNNSLGDVKAFIAKAFNIPETDVDPAGALLVVGEKQPLKGYHLKATMFDVTTGKGNLFTRADWSHLSGPVAPPAAPAA